MMALIPTDIEPRTGLASSVEGWFTKLHAGGKFGGGFLQCTLVVCTVWV